MGSKQVLGVGVILLTALFVSLIDIPMTQSQTTCPQGAYTLNGDLTVTGKVKAQNVAAQQSSFGSCELITGLNGATCPSGKVVTGAYCAGGRFLIQTSGMTHDFFSACNILFLKDGTQVSSNTIGVNGASCSCPYSRMGGGQSGTLSMFCC